MSTDDYNAYMEGRRAYNEFVSVKDNPYPVGVREGISNSRWHWYIGWYDEWRYQKWGPNKDEAVLGLN